MWKNLLEGTEAAIAAALEHTSFPKPDEDDEETNKDRKSNDSNEMTLNETSMELKESKKEKRAWYEENEDDEQPSEDNWFMPTTGIDLGGLPSIFSNTKNENNNQEMYETIHSGWDHFQKAAQVQFSEAQKFLQESVDTVVNLDSLQSTYIPRDLSLPFDIDAIDDTDLYYITDRIISISHLHVKSKISNQRKLSAVEHLLQKRHMNHFMIWDLSIDDISSILEDQVISTSFYGLTCPPLGLLIRLILSIDHWLKSSPKNVAVFCFTDKGQIAMLVACFLSWTNEAGFHNPTLALEYISKCQNISPTQLTIPSQRRYISYFEKILEGSRPRVSSIWLKRIILSEVPKISSSNNDKMETFTIDIFKGGSLIFSTTAAMTNSSGSISFDVDLDLQGDILFQCNEKKIPMFCALFHTGFVETSKVLRFTKSQLDENIEISNDFYVDLVFKYFNDKKEDTVSDKKDWKTDLAIIPSKYDSILFKHSHFWENITNRRKEMLNDIKNLDEMKQSGSIIGNVRSFQNKDSKGDSFFQDSNIMENKNGMSTKEEKKRLKNRKFALLDILSISDDEDLILRSKSNDEDEIVFDNDETVHDLLTSLDEKEDKNVSNDSEDNQLKDLDDLENFLEQM